MDAMDCGPTCLKMVAEHYGKLISLNVLRERSHILRDGVSLSGLSEAAESIGFGTLAAAVNFQTLKEEIPLPCIVYWRKRHFIVVYGFKGDQVLVADPAFGYIKYNKRDFTKGWIGSKGDPQEEDEGIILALEPDGEADKSDDFTEQKEARSKFSSLFSLFRPYRKYLIQIFVGIIFSILIQLSLPFLTQSMVDIGVSNNNLQFVYMVLVAQLVFFLSESLIRLFRNWILLHVTSRVNIRLLSNYLGKMMKLPLSFFDSKNIGDLLQRIQDNDRIQAFLSSQSLLMIFSTLNILVFGTVLAWYNPLIFLIFIIGTSFYLIWISFFMKKRKILDYRLFDEASGNQSSMIQLINGMQEIKLNNSERKRRWEWEAIQVRLFRLSIRSLSITQAQDIGGNFINQITNILITFLSVKLVIDGQITLGMMLSIQFILGQLNVPISNFVQFFRDLQDAKISYSRMREIYDKKSEDNLDSISELGKDYKNIEISDVSFRYGGETSPYVLKNINVTIPRGKVVAIVGESGSGKTTFLKMLLQFYPPTKGKISIGGIDLKLISNTYWRSKCGIVMQDGFIFSDSIARNIAESDPNGILDFQKISQAADVANISNFIQELPESYNTRIGSSGISLSGGQRQRIQIARAVYKNPEFIFFDEATSALDSNNEKIVMRNLQEFYKEKTVLIVAHRLSTVINADLILVLKDGEIIERGDHTSLVENRGQYYELIKNQLELGE